MQRSFEKEDTARQRGNLHACPEASAWALYRPAAGRAPPAKPPQGTRTEQTGLAQPLASGQIAFIPLGAEAAPTAGATIAQGRYQIAADQGPFPGEHRVEIRAFRSTGKKVWDGMGDENAPASQKRYVEELEQYLPRLYNDESTLRVTITGPKPNRHDFALRGPASPRR